jgi:hypothetical protein
VIYRQWHALTITQAYSGPHWSLSFSFSLSLKETWACMKMSIHGSIESGNQNGTQKRFEAAKYNKATIHVFNKNLSSDSHIKTFTLISLYMTCFLLKVLMYSRSIITAGD